MLKMNTMHITFVVIAVLFSAAVYGKKGHGSGEDHELDILRQNLTALWERVHELENDRGVHVHLAQDMHTEDKQPEEHHEEEDHEDGSSKEKAKQDVDHGTHIYLHLQTESDTVTKAIKAMHELHPDGYIYAQCNIHPNKDENGHDMNHITGKIVMRQKIPDGPIEVDTHYEGVEEIEEFMLDVHQYGDDSHGCDSMGEELHFPGDHKVDGHYTTGEWAVYHHGDVKLEHDHFENTHSSLMGYRSIMGRSIVFDKPHGPGEEDHRFACCVIAQIHKPEDHSLFGEEVHSDSPH